MGKNDNLTRLLDELALLGVDVSRLLLRAREAEELVREWRAANGITTDEKLVSALPALLAGFPPSPEWQSLACAAEVLEAPSVRFAVVELWRDAARNRRRLGGQDARKVLAEIAAALAFTGPALKAAEKRARHLDRRRWEESHRLADELRALYRREGALGARERERLARLHFISWDGRALAGIDPALLLEIVDALRLRPRGKRPFLVVAASLLGAPAGDLDALRERRKKWGIEAKVSPFGPGSRRDSLSGRNRKETHKCRDRETPNVPAERSSPSTSRRPSSAARPSRAPSTSPKGRSATSSSGGSGRSPSAPKGPGSSSTTSTNGSRTSAAAPRRRPTGRSRSSGS